MGAPDWSSNRSPTYQHLYDFEGTANLESSEIVNLSIVSISPKWAHRLKTPAQAQLKPRSSPIEHKQIHIV